MRLNQPVWGESSGEDSCLNRQRSKGGPHSPMRDAKHRRDRSRSASRGTTSVRCLQHAHSAERDQPDAARTGMWSARSKPTTHGSSKLLSASPSDPGSPSSSSTGSAVTTTVAAAVTPISDRRGAPSPLRHDRLRDRQRPAGQQRLQDSGRRFSAGAQGPSVVVKTPFGSLASGFSQASEAGRALARPALAAGFG
jgi:hypothetical protein